MQFRGERKAALPGPGPAGREHAVGAMRNQRLTQDEVAAVLGMSRGCVASIERKAMRKIREAWKRQDAMLGPVRGINL